MTDSEYFMALLKYSNQLKKENKNLRRENPEKFDVFLEFLVRIEAHLNYLEKETYISLVKDFLAGNVTADDFSHIFSQMYHGVAEKLSQMQRDESSELKALLELELKPHQSRLLDLLVKTDGACDAFSLDPEIALSDEEELKIWAQALLLHLQKN